MPSWEEYRDLARASGECQAVPNEVSVSRKVNTVMLGSTSSPAAPGMVEAPGRALWAPWWQGLLGKVPHQAALLWVYGGFVPSMEVVSLIGCWLPCRMLGPPE